MELIKNLKAISLIKSLFLAILGTILLAISSKIKIPFWPVPMTMQTFVVLYFGNCLWMETWSVHEYRYIYLRE